MLRQSIERLIATLLLILLLPLVVLVGLTIVLTSKGPALHWSTRVGVDNVIFLMPKFRTMYVDTPDVATHLLIDPSTHVTRIGAFLRKTSIDEIPQLVSVVQGKMNFVGPRPALHSQSELIEQRTKLGVNLVKPGITGWAQINGRDEISIREKVELDWYYLKNKSIWFDIKIVFATLLRVVWDSSVSH